MQQQPTRNIWIGGPRPPVATNLRRTGTKDDLEIRESTETVINPSLVAMLSGNNGEGSTEPRTPDRALRRWALDLETEQRWQHMLHMSRPSQSATPSSSSSPIDSRRQFFGPRQPRRNRRSSPLTPNTPYSPFTPYTPDSPELETPADDISGSTHQQISENDPEKGHPHGPEFLITPFLLKEPTTSSSPANEDDTAAGMIFSARPPFTVRRHPVIAPLAPSRSARVDSTRSRGFEQYPDSNTGSHVLPSPSQSDFSQTRSSTRSSRPRLSIVTSASWSKHSTLPCEVPSEPLPVPSAAPREPPTVIGQLTHLLATDVLLDKLKYKTLLAYRGDEAQQILDCLQVVLDAPSLRGPERATILKALTRLSERSGLYPRCFKLHGVVPQGNEAIDEGRYGDVWKATFHDQVVCLKILRTYQRMPTQPLLKNLSNEALLWGQLSHPNILPFYGIHINEVRRNRFGLVSPWMENGNIVNYLKRNPDVPRIPLLHDIASGLRYLHNLNVVHGDIKGTNILVTSEGRACLADFGLSTLLGDNILAWSDSEPSRSGGTTRWRAPELFLQDSMDNDIPPTQSSDVYSFACVAYEILTGRIPFYDIKGEGNVIMAKISRYLQPTRPSLEEAGKELTDEVWKLLENCWMDPDDRPTLDQILQRLEALMCSGQIQVARDGSTGVGNCIQPDGRTVLSSSCFRKSFKGDDVPSDEDLLQVVSMISI